MSHELLAATVQLPEERLLACAREAVAAGLLTATSDGYAFPHTLIRQVLYAQPLPGERRRLHRRLAEELAASPGADPGPLARHWHLAGCQDRAAAAAVTAARQAIAARAYPEAYRNYDLAIRLARWLPEAGPGLLEEAAQAASWAQHPDSAARWAADALAGLPRRAPTDRARLLERLGRYRWEAGDPTTAAVEAAEQAVALLEAEPPSALQARVMAALATRRMLLGLLDDALPLAARAVDVARQVGATAEHAQGLATLGIIQAQRGELDAGLAALRTSAALALRAGSIENVVRAAANHMYLLLRAGRFAEALQVAGNGQQAARSLDAPSALTWVLDNNTAAVLLTTGRWAEADRLLADLSDELAANATRYLQLLWLELAVGRGETERSAELAAILGKVPRGPAGHRGGARLPGRAGAECRRSRHRRPRSGRRAVGGAGRCPGRGREPAARRRRPSKRRAGPVAGRGAAGRSRRRVGAAGGRLRRPGQSNRRPAARTAGSSRIRGPGGRRARPPARPRRPGYLAFGSAGMATGLSALPGGLCAAARGGGCRRAGRREQAARALAACQNLARELPAAPLLTLAEDLARRARLTGHPGPPPGSAAASARSDLTDRETEVLARLASGDSNRQIARALFISDRTVAVHISRILGKLGVRNRTEAATIGARLGLTPPAPPDEVPHVLLVSPGRRRPDDLETQ